MIPREKQMVTGLYEAGLGYKKIAIQTGLPENTQ